MILKLYFIIVCVTLCYAGVPIVVGKARPCDLKDYACIQSNLAANSHCKPRSRPIRSPYVIPRLRFDTPAFNATYFDNNLQITGMERCFVSEFFFNVNGDSGVLGVDCPWLNCASERDYLQHRPLLEDQVFKYSINGTYPLIRLTMTLVNADRLNICNEFTSVHIPHLPIYAINPKDKSTRNKLSRDLTMLGVFESETFHYRANLLIREFINSRLCDFGCY